VDIRVWGKRQVRDTVRQAYWWVYGQAYDPPEHALARWAACRPDQVSIGHDTIITEAMFDGDLRDCRLTIGDTCDIKGVLFFQRPGATISIGSRCQLNGCHIDAAQRITIGDDVLLAGGVHVVDHNSHAVAWSQRRHDQLRKRADAFDWSNVAQQPVHIADSVWIGLRAIILKGVTIGEGAVVGAGSVVTKDVPPWTMAAGNPARIVREFRPEERE